MAHPPSAASHSADDIVASIRKVDLFACCARSVESRVTPLGTNIPAVPTQTPPATSARESGSNMAREQQQEYHYPDDAEDTARPVSPTRAVPPVWNYTDQGENQDDQQQHT